MAIHHLKENFDAKDYNIGMNNGVLAGQTIIRFHCHVIPRYLGDMINPEGGIRHCIKGKGYYTPEKKENEK
jgi:diadenosine tetraphosphate (Ap4A) HIT family hydrolase